MTEASKKESTIFVLMTLPTQTGDITHFAVVIIKVLHKNNMF